MRSSRRTRPSPERNTRPRRTRGGTLLGVFIGLVIGLALAATVAFYLGRSGFSTPLVPAGAAKDSGRGSRSEQAVASTDKDKPRFDFYKILPGGEEPKAPVDRKGIDKLERPPDRVPPAVVAKPSEPQPPKDPGKASDRFWLQAGAFNGESDAENLKARLALSGWEAVIQTVPLPDKGVRYRVRMGPYDNTDELNRIKGELVKNGFDVAVIRNP